MLPLLGEYLVGRNVLVTLKDFKLGQGATASSTVAVNYTAKVAGYSDYYPFGMQMPARVWNQSGYRFGFNGQEKDDEVHGVGNTNTSFFRELDVRTIRWLSIDPKAAASPWSSPYLLNGNNPIIMMDPKGDKEYDSKEGYEKANKGKSWNKDRGKGDWLIEDRKNNTDLWKSANSYNLKQEKGADEYTSIEQRADFYGWFQNTSSKGTRWAERHPM